jgi:hypothetical protein
MSKEFIPYEQALELKELGFNELCLFYYTDNESLRIYHQSEIYDDLVGAPLYQQAFRWFRETHKWNHSVSTKRFPNVEYGYILGAMEGESSVWNINEFSTYEEAELACLKKLIEIAKQK